MVVLVWRGAGILVAIVAAVALFAGDCIAEALFGQTASDRIRALIICWMTAFLTLPLAFIFRPHTTQPGRSQPGSEENHYTRHDLFFIPLAWWPAVFFVLGVVTYIVMAPRGRL